MAKAHYLEKALCALPGVEPVYGGAHFHEFVLENAPQPGAAGGPGPPGHPAVRLWATTGSCGAPRRRSPELDEAVSIVKEVLDK